MVVMASEVGVLDIKPENIKSSGRLEPGKMFYIDTETGRVVEDDEVKEEILSRRFYSQWLKENMVELDEISRVSVTEEEKLPPLTLLKAFGYTREEAVGRLINDLVATPSLRAHAAELSYRVGHGHRVECEAKRRRKDGTLFDVSILGAPIIHGGKQMGVYAVYRDITARKKAEEALSESEARFRLMRWTLQSYQYPDYDYPTHQDAVNFDYDEGIWNNGQPDTAALYDRFGNLVSEATYEIK
jgi:PAS domain S-box-containing protein